MRQQPILRLPSFQKMSELPRILLTQKVEFNMDPLVAVHLKGLPVNETDNTVVLNREDIISSLTTSQPIPLRNMIQLGSSFFVSAMV